MPTAGNDDAFAEVKARVDLVKVVQEHVRLTKRNRDLWGLCPFHQEDSPSFKVDPQRQSWYCFGCERHGDVFTFVELIEKTDKRGALQVLAERAGVELQQLSPEQRERADTRKRVLAMLKLAAQYYEYVLWSTPTGESGRRLLERRQVGEETARRFQLGYAPAGRGFAEYLRAKKRSLTDAQAAGLMRRDGTDFFAQRLVIPIRDERGQTLAFTARTIRADEPRKYINSPETPAYVKGRVIFGLDLAREEITRRGRALLMEGQFDVITAHQFGVTNAVASSGTALTEDQVRLLKRFTDEVVFVFDFDRAGRNAALKAGVLAANRGLRSRTIWLPEGKDPDEWFRGAGPEAATQWEKVVESAAESFDAVLTDLVSGFNPTDPIQHQMKAAEIRAIIRSFPPERWAAYAELAERRARIPRDLLLTEPVQPAGSIKRWNPSREGPGKYLVQLLAVRPDAFERIRGHVSADEFEVGERGIYVRMLESFERAGPQGLEAELSGYPAEEQEVIRRAWAKPPPRVDDEVAEELAKRVRLNHMKNTESGIIRELSEAERVLDSERAVRMQTQLTQIGRAIAELEKEILTSRA